MPGGLTIIRSTIISKNLGYHNGVGSDRLGKHDSWGAEGRWRGMARSRLMRPDIMVACIGLASLQVDNQ